MRIDIPGLNSIKDEIGPDGITRIIFDVDDDRIEEFFTAFGLVSGDIEGFQHVVTSALEAELKRLENKQQT